LILARMSGNKDGEDSPIARASGLSAKGRLSEDGNGVGSPGARASTISSGGRNSLEIEDAHGVAPKRGMILPFQPLAISFDDVCYYVDMPAVSPLSHLI
jgi:hypothetical protein